MFVPDWLLCDWSFSLCPICNIVTGAWILEAPTSSTPSPSWTHLLQMVKSREGRCSQGGHTVKRQTVPSELQSRDFRLNSWQRRAFIQRFCLTGVWSCSQQVFLVSAWNLSGRAVWGAVRALWYLSRSSDLLWLSPGLQPFPHPGMGVHRLQSVTAEGRGTGVSFQNLSALASVVTVLFFPFLVLNFEVFGWCVLPCMKVLKIRHCLKLIL